MIPFVAHYHDPKLTLLLPIPVNESMKLATNFITALLGVLITSLEVKASTVANATIAVGQESSSLSAPGSINVNTSLYEETSAQSETIVTGVNDSVEKGVLIDVTDPFAVLDVFLAHAENGLTGQGDNGNWTDHNIASPKSFEIAVREYDRIIAQ